MEGSGSYTVRVFIGSRVHSRRKHVLLNLIMMGSWTTATLLAVLTARVPHQIASRENSG